MRRLSAHSTRAGQLVNREEFERQVRAANAIVKNTVLGVIEQADLPHEVRARLKHDMLAVLNNLAYEQQEKASAPLLPGARSAE